MLARVMNQYDIAGASGDVIDVYTTGVNDAPALQAVFAQVVATGQPKYIQCKGARFGAFTPNAVDALDFTGLPDGTVVDFGGRVVHFWDVTQPDNSIGSLVVGTATGITIKNFVYELYPRPNFEGYVTNVDRPNGFIDIRAKPGFEPNFPTMDYIRAIEPSGRWADRQYEGSGGGSGLPYPVNPIGNGIYRLGRVSDINKTATAVTNYNPLTLTVPSHNFQADENGDSQVVVIASGFVGGDVSGINQLNGNNFGVEVVSPNTIRLLSGDEYIDATGWTPITQTGILTNPGIPAWIVNGLEVWGAARKRASPVIDPTYAKNWKILAQFKSAVSVCVKGKYWENPYVELMMRGDGVVACNAGGFIPAEVRGDIKGWMEVYGAGDDAFNVAGFFWGKRILSTTANTITVSNTVFLPREADVIRFESPSRVVSTRKVTSVDTSTPSQYTVTLDGNLPTGWDNTTWITRNYSVVGRIQFERFRQVGGGRSFLAQSNTGYVGEGYFQNLRGPSVRAHFPNSQHHFDQGLANGGVQFGTLTCINTNYDYSTYACAVLQHWNIVANGADNFPPYRYPSTVIDSYDFSAVNADGFDVDITALYLRNPGTRRSTTRQTMLGQDVLGNYDLHANYGTLHIGYLDPKCFPWIKYRMRNGGRIVVDNRGRGVFNHSTDQDVTVDNLATGLVLATGAKTGTRKVTLLPGLAQPNDSVTVDHNGSGSSLQIWDSVSNTQIATAVAGGPAITLRFTGTNWIA